MKFDIENVTMEKIDSLNSKSDDKKLLFPNEKKEYIKYILQMISKCHSPEIEGLHMCDIGVHENTVKLSFCTHDGTKYYLDIIDKEVNFSNVTSGNPSFEIKVHPDDSIKLSFLNEDDYICVTKKSDNDLFVELYLGIGHQSIKENKFIPDYSLKLSAYDFSGEKGYYFVNGIKYLTSKDVSLDTMRTIAIAYYKFRKEKIEGLSYKK